MEAGALASVCQTHPMVMDDSPPVGGRGLVVHTDTVVVRVGSCGEAVLCTQVVCHTSGLRKRRTCEVPASLLSASSAALQRAR
eukprot:364057-Chlamydomonas_euryale.AAC.4